MKKQLLVLLIVLAPGMLAGQISVSNQMEYSYWREYNRNILENWLDLAYQQPKYTFGLRYEINQPPDPFIFPLDSLVQQQELTFKYAELYQDGLTLRVGNFYGMFGRGLTLRSYEDRNLRVDNNIEGIKANFTSRHVDLIALGGRMRDKYNRRDDRLYGVDGTVRWKLVKLGGSFLRSQRSDQEWNEIAAARINPTLAGFDFYSEFARAASSRKLSNYSSLSYSHEKFSLLAEYKNYQRLTFANSFGTEYNAPPALSREHAYALLNRHPHALNANDEHGYQLEGTAALSQNLSLLLNYSFTESQQNRRLFEEYYGQLTWLPNDSWHLEALLGWNYDFSSRTENLTPIGMAEFSWGGSNQIHLEIQHQHVRNEVDQSEYDDELMVLEYSRAPGLSLALVGEYSNRYLLRNVLEQQKYWLYGQVTLALLESHQISILYGSRQAGFVCAGGVCRFEPEFEGLELKLMSRF